MADAAESAGLSDVEIRQYAADGRDQWWTFRAPVAWTPRHALLSLGPATALEPLVAYPGHPYSLATYSAPTDEECVPLVDAARLAGSSPPWPVVRGALVLLPAASEPPSGWITRLLLEDLARSGARGIATDIPAQQWRGRAEGAYTSGRLELSSHSSLYGFSLPPVAMDRLQAAERAGVPATVSIEVTRDAHMPVVQGVMPGARAAPEILLTAHLCHPAPAANDNASGVVALLGIATALSAIKRATPGGDAPGTVRFLWAPEFAGTAAFLHEHLSAGRDLPSFVINMDMVGEDQALCGGPLTVESGPSHIPSILPALAEDFLHLLPTPARSYAGAVPLADWAWSAVPFSGGSDHSLFADRSTACPALCVGHWPDRYRHSSLDTPDKLSSDELLRAGTLVGGMAQFLRHLGPAELPYVHAAVSRWTLGCMMAICRTAQHRPTGTTAGAGGGMFDPFGPSHVAGFLRHQAEFARAALSALPGPVDSDDLATELVRQAGTLESPVRPFPEPSRQEPRYWRRWPGPFNYEGLLEAATVSDRNWLLAEEGVREAAYAKVVALALAVDDGASIDAAMAHAAYSTWLPIDRAFATRVLAVLESAGWVATQPPADEDAGSRPLET